MYLHSFALYRKFRKDLSRLTFVCFHWCSQIKRETFNKETVSLFSFGCTFVFSSLAVQNGINNTLQTLREADLLSLLRDANKVFCRRILLHTLLHALLLYCSRFGGHIWWKGCTGKKLDTLNHSES